MSMEDLKKIVANAIKKSSISTIIGNKIYTPEELAREIENETEIGKKMIEIAIKGTIERYTKSRGEA
ncbi:MAG: hypothetical protein QXK24_08855 [Ignisphaera sp.]